MSSPGVGSQATNQHPAAPLPSPLPDREVYNPFLRYALHVVLPVAISISVHVGALIFAAAYGIRVLGSRTLELSEWEGSVVDAADLSDAFQWGEATALPLPEEPAAEVSLDKLLPSQDLGPTDLSALADSPAGGGLGQGSGIGLGDGVLSLLGTGSGAGETGSGGFGSGFGSGTHIGQAGVWDLTIRADAIVYVVDFSGSIIVAVDDLKRELKRSVGRLQPSQSFNVILFYSSGGGQDEKVRTESFRPKLEPADEAVRREFFEWIKSRAPMGVTEPLPAIKRALAMQPQAIFFFSDGYFDDSVLAEVERANRGGRTRIYCLVFDELLLQDTSGLPRETDGARRMKRLAEANGGKARIVTGKDLRR